MKTLGQAKHSQHFSNGIVGPGRMSVSLNMNDEVTYFYFWHPESPTGFEGDAEDYKHFKDFVDEIERVRK